MVTLAKRAPADQPALLVLIARHLATRRQTGRLRLGIQLDGLVEPHQREIVAYLAPVKLRMNGDPRRTVRLHRLAVLELVTAMHAHVDREHRRARRIELVRRDVHAQALAVHLDQGFLDDAVRGREHGLSVDEHAAAARKDRPRHKPTRLVLDYGLVVEDDESRGGPAVSGDVLRHQRGPSRLVLVWLALLVGLWRRGGGRLLGTRHRTHTETALVTVGHAVAGEAPIAHTLRPERKHVVDACAGSFVTFRSQARNLIKNENINN